MPPLYIDRVEAIWITASSLGLGLTLVALFDAWRDVRVAAGVDRRRATIVTARGNVRREFLRAIVQLILLVFVVPGIFIDRETPVTPGTVAAIAIPVLLLLSTAFDTLDRYRLRTLVLEDIATDRAATALEASVQENIALTKEVGVQAEAAYHEANTVNEKIAALTELVGHKEDKPAAES